jgi:hypothetical protein
LWSQCATTDFGGCGTGNCSSTAYACGVYTDNAQHGSCMLSCQGCAAGGGGCTGLSAAPGSLGCGTVGDICTACSSGTCTSLPDSTPCGVNMICQTGVCTPVGGCGGDCNACCQSFGGSSGQCVADVATCASMFGTNIPPCDASCTGGCVSCCFP